MADFDPTTERDLTRPGCEPGQTALQRLLDGEPAWDTSEAAAHRGRCTDCREELALARSFGRLATDVVVPASLTERLVTKSVQAHRARRARSYLAVAVALAASVLVVVFATRPWGEPTPEPEPSVAYVPPPAGPTAPDETPQGRPLGEAVSEARDALVSLTRRTANEPGERVGQLLPTPKLPDGPDAGADLQPLADARTGAARSVEPITDSARRAMNFLLRAADPPDRGTQP
jgi:hypothetical protein